MANKKIVFLTGTRADFGKIKSLINICHKNKELDVHIFCTGMHMNTTFGGTVNEITNSNIIPRNKIFLFYNHYNADSMDNILAKTIDGFSAYVKDIKPDLIVIHGDRVEALAGAIVGSTNNVLTAHIEGGELSGTIDDSIRHSVSKLCHLHFVSTDAAKTRLLQMGENKNSIYVIGNPALDVLNSKKLPTLNSVKKYYDIKFKEYAIFIFHPVTTELDTLEDQIKTVVDVVKSAKLNFIVIYPNNDTGSEIIFRHIKPLEKLKNFKLFSSLKFEYYHTLLKHSKFIIGNSSSGIHEAPVYGVPAINIGTRQNNRFSAPNIFNVNTDYDSIFVALNFACYPNSKHKHIKKQLPTKGSDKKFIKIISSPKIWETPKQKTFIDYEKN